MTSRQATTPDDLMATGQNALSLTAIERGTALASAPHHQEQPLREAVDAAMRRYFDHLDGGVVTDLYAMVMAEVEAPLLATVMEHANGNQTRAAEMLGLNRGTLRKKLKQYALI